MAHTDIDLSELKSTVVHLRSVLRGLEGAKNMMLSAVETVSKDKIIALHQQIRSRRIDAEERGLWEIAQTYRECEEMLARAQPADMVGDLLQVKDKLQSTGRSYSEPNYLLH